jgi:hypothetical protein
MEFPGDLEVGDRTPTRAETRYGCFLPDLTGLARSPSGPISQPEYNNRTLMPKALNDREIRLFPLLPLLQGISRQINAVINAACPG